jgi:hypothetical protein
VLPPQLSSVCCCSFILPEALHPGSVHQAKRFVHDEDYLTSDVALYGLTTGRHEKDV